MKREMQDIEPAFLPLFTLIICILASGKKIKGRMNSNMGPNTTNPSPKSKVKKDSK